MHRHEKISPKSQNQNRRLSDSMLSAGMAGHQSGRPLSVAALPTAKGPHPTSTSLLDFFRTQEKTLSMVIDYLHPSSISDVMEELNTGKYGSVTQDIGNLMSLKNQLISCDVIDVEDDYDSRSIVPLQVGTGLQACLAGPLVILDSDDEEYVNNGSSNRQKDMGVYVGGGGADDDYEDNENGNGDELGDFRKKIEDEIAEEKARNTRTYPYIPREFDAPAHDFEVADISARPLGLVKPS